mmetsp:Transcript_26783/g.46465  ORF Transcript_26783/g.46465 Transcript_26783/m.46465 type:complete len:217 (-) Transcript_26783:241-891(-)
MSSIAGLPFCFAQGEDCFGIVDPASELDEHASLTKALARSAKDPLILAFKKLGLRVIVQLEASTCWSIASMKASLLSPTGATAASQPNIGHRQAFGAECRSDSRSKHSTCLQCWPRTGTFNRPAESGHVSSNLYLFVVKHTSTSSPLTCFRDRSRSRNNRCAHSGPKTSMSNAFGTDDRRACLSAALRASFATAAAILTAGVDDEIMLRDSRPAAT